MHETKCRIGPWDFDASANELCRGGGDRVRLEHRAARVLELLCDNRGEVVSQDRLRAEVWNGRHLSAHSLPIVIGQLRRALGENARSPRFIETLPKRGYRLSANEAAPLEAVARRPRLMPAFGAAALVAAIAAGVVYSRARPAPPVIGVTAVANETGSARYAPLARATDAVILSALTRRGFAVQPGALEGGTTFEARLVLWNGEPSVGLTAVGPDGIVRWSGTTMGGAAKIPVEVDRNVDQMAAAIGVARAASAP